MPHNDSAQERKKVERAWAEYLNLAHNAAVDFEAVVSAVCDVAPLAAPHSPECPLEQPPRTNRHPRS